MAFTDSMFLFEIVVEELTSYINCSEFHIRGQFADVFNAHLEDPHKIECCLPKQHGKQARKLKIKRKPKTKPDKRPEIISSMAPTVQSGQTILFAINVDTLISNMKQYPLELSLWSKVVPDYKIGSTDIPWSAPYYDYLNKLAKRQDLQPICVVGDYNVFDEISSKRMAVIKLNVKLRHFKDRITTQIKYIKPTKTQQTNTTMTTGLSSKPASEVSTNNKDIIPFNLAEETGLIKTIYSGDKRKPNSTKKRTVKKIETKSFDNFGDKVDDLSKELVKVDSAEVDSKIYNRRLNSGLISLLRSDTKLDNNPTLSVIRSKSYPSIDERNSNMLNDYIFGGTFAGPLVNKVYCVNYFTVEKDFADSPSPKSPISASSPNSPNSAKTVKSTSGSAKSTSGTAKSSSGTEKSKSEKSVPGSEKSDKNDESQITRYKFRVCKSECPFRQVREPILPGTQSVCSLDLPEKASHLIKVKKCDDVKCGFEKMREVPTPPDDRILLNLSTRSGVECCEVSKEIEEVVAGMKAKMKFGKAPCYCECECKFRFMKKTTFCKICKGYERFGEEYGHHPGYDLPFPCPIYHKLAEMKNKMKMSTSGSDTKNRKETKKKEIEKEPEKVTKKKEAEKEPEKVTKKKEPEKEPEKVTESAKETKKRKKKDNRFKFNHGYTGISPHIGHSRCALPCVGTLGAVPKGMGWLWNCENVPGMKYRPQWRPGASNKHVVRLLKMAKNPEDFLAKKRRKEKGKPKRPLKRPLLTVQKKDGEFTVTMETMKTFVKPRTFNQYPYEDKPLVIYTIGRTSEENLQRKIKKERAQRRLERLQRDFVQSAFRDMCQEICLKTYQQALGLLPNAEQPDCSCFPAAPGPDDVDLDHSCSCSEDKELSESDTDSDEWLIEFTPPTATFDPTFKSKKIVYVDSTTQYTYLDYRVKLLDRLGNPVPRFFKGPDGKQQCSDLGGFWDPEHNWLEINVDGFIGPDEKWAPNNFLGPNNEMVDGEPGKFQAMDGKWLVIGVDGYVDQGKWKFYAKSRSPEEKTKWSWKRPGGGIKDDKQSKYTWSCFGSASPKQLSKMGIVGHGYDKKLLNTRIQDLMAHGEDIKIPQPSSVPRSSRPKGKRGARSRMFVERRQCKHAAPSDKGIVAVDGRGNKTYFRLKDYNNRRPEGRVTTLTDQGISVSSFHVPCFSSFISTEMMKKQQYDRLVAMAERRAQQGQGHEGSRGTRSTAASTPVADYTGVYVV